jgi:hypothetical protein
MAQHDIEMQAPLTESLPAPCCGWCLYPLILCPYHPSELVPYVEPGPSLLDNELTDWINSADAAEIFRQIAASTELVPYEEPDSSARSPYNEVIYGTNIAETFRQIAASTELVPYDGPGPSSPYNEVINIIEISGFRQIVASTELVPYEEPGPSSPYNEVINTVETSGFRQILASTELITYDEPGPSSPYNEVIDGINDAETFRQIVASEELVAASNNRRKTGTGRFPCTLCPANFTANHNLQSTSRSALSIFATTDPFIGHLDSHYGRKNHHCVPEGCGSSFATKSSLNRHRKKCKKGMM